MQRLFAIFLICFSSPIWAQGPVFDCLALLQSIEHPVIESGNYQVSRHYTDAHNGVSHVYGYQTFKGIEIEGSYFSAHAQRGEIVAFHHAFNTSANGDKQLQHRLDYAEALDAYINMGHQCFKKAVSSNEIWEKTTENQYQLLDKTLSSEAIRAKKTYVWVNDVLTPSWSISILLPDNSHWYYAVLNALDGSLIDQYDWMLHCTLQHDHAEHAFHKVEERSGRASNKKAGEAKYAVFAFPIESPNHGDMTLLEDPADKSASPFGWHDDDGNAGAEHTITKGNNVYASEDKAGENEPGYSPNGGDELIFDFPFLDGPDHEKNLDASITNLFYANNVMHDIFYHYGFDEKSGNFQENNYGKYNTGEGDPVFADGQDGADSSNANFATPVDGQNPRMQMFLWGASGNLNFEITGSSIYAGKYLPKPADFKPYLNKDPILGKLVLVSDGTEDSTLGCDTLVNADAIKGNIALIERGDCNLALKVLRAQEAGAIAAVIFTNGKPIIVIPGDSNKEYINIPSVMISRTLGKNLVSELTLRDVEVALYDSTKTGGKDPDFDNGMIAHEYAHGISMRLTGGALNSNCLTNEEQMGEGWSDFIALVTTHMPEHKATTPRSFASYSSGEDVTGNGLRSYPYSTDMSVSPYLYHQIAEASSRHDVGAIWCAMLWDLYWAMIEEHGFDTDLYEGHGGNNKCLQLVIDAMKLQVCNPGFIDARDAILLADRLNNDGENDYIIWKAFARRGLGWDADGGDPDNRKDGKNGFDLPPKFSGYIGLKMIAPTQINETEPLVYTIEIENASETDFVNVTVVDTVPKELIIDQGSMDCPWHINGQIMTFNIDKLSAGELLSCSFTTNTKPGLYTLKIAEDGAENENEHWTTESVQGKNEWHRQLITRAEGFWAWHVESTSSISDQNLLFEIGQVEVGTILSFQHSFNIEKDADGAVVEFSEDGENWMDAGTDFVSGGYNGEVSNSPSNPLNGRKLFTGNSKGFITSKIDLTRYAGKAISVRFRFASDEKVQKEGWYVDDLKVGNYLEVTNRVHAQISDKKSSHQVTTVILDNDSTNSLFDWKQQKSLAQLFPNPVVQIAHIYLPEIHETATLSICSIDGRQVFLSSLIGGENQLNLQQISAGSYIVSITIDGRTERHRLIKR